MKAIIKNSNSGFISYLFLVVNKEAILAGMIEPYALKKMIEHRKAIEVDATEILEQFWHSTQIIDEVQTTKYYYLQ